MTTSELPPEADRLLATAPSEFVSERTRIVRELGDAGRKDDARAVAGLRKPSAVVLAVNRAARDRPQAARDAADAAARVRQTQLSGEADGYRAATKELDDAVDLLADVAVAHVSLGSASESMRRRVRQHLRAAVADEGGRDALVRGSLREELEASGFSPFEGLSAPPRKPRGSQAAKKRQARADEKRKVRERELREELARAETALELAQKAVDDATRERDAAEREVARARRKLERL